MKLLPFLLTLIVSLNANYTYAYKKGFISFEVKSGAVFESAGSDNKVYPASLTKLMTAYVILKRNKPTEEQAKISKRAWGHYFSNSSRMFLEPGMEVTIDDLLKGLLVQSGNDAAIALAENHSGSVEEFVSLMNKTANELGMLNTKFENPNGRHNRNHYTTANDFRKLIVAIFENTPEITEFTSLKEFTFNGIRQWNRNRTLKEEHSIGLKTGFTPQSGFNLAACYTLNNGVFCTLQFGANSIEERHDKSVLAHDTIFVNRQAYHLALKSKKITLDGIQYLIDIKERYILSLVEQDTSASLILDKNVNGAVSSAAHVMFKVGVETFNIPVRLLRYNQIN